MKKALIFFIIFAIAAISLHAMANKYKEKERSITQAQINTAEETESMSDCMTFCASHKSRGKGRDCDMFSKQFGPMIEDDGTLKEYNYDSYTKVILDCQKPSCYCRCLSKN